MYSSSNDIEFTRLAKLSPLMPADAIYGAFKGDNCKIPFPVLTNQNQAGGVARGMQLPVTVYRQEGDLNLWTNPYEQSMPLQKSDTSLIGGGAVETSIFRLSIPGHGGSPLELLNPGTNDSVR